MIAHYSIRTGPALWGHPSQRKTPAGANRQGGGSKTKLQVKHDVKYLNCLDREYIKPVSREEGKMRFAEMLRSLMEGGAQ